MAGLCTPADIPKATILHWDRVKKQFGEMLAMTDDAERRTRQRRHVPVEDMYKHRYALRLATGRSRHVVFTTIKANPVTAGGSAKDIPILMFASGDRGTLAYEFNMIEVKGMRSLTAVAGSPTGKTGYAGDHLSRLPYHDFITFKCFVVEFPMCERTITSHSFLPSLFCMCIYLCEGISQQRSLCRNSEACA
jgi:hypothetical protein